MVGRRSREALTKAPKGLPNVAQGNALGLGLRPQHNPSPWLVELRYSFLSQIMRDLGSAGGEASPPAVSTSHAVRPRTMEFVFQLGGLVTYRLQFVELPEPLSSKIQG